MPTASLSAEVALALSTRRCPERTPPQEHMSNRGGEDEHGGDGESGPWPGRARADTARPEGGEYAEPRHPRGDSVRPRVDRYDVTGPSRAGPGADHSRRLGGVGEDDLHGSPQHGNPSPNRRHHGYAPDARVQLQRRRGWRRSADGADSHGSASFERVNRHDDRKLAIRRGHCSASSTDHPVAGRPMGTGWPRRTVRRQGGG
jgi:hypothetical protein